MASKSINIVSVTSDIGSVYAGKSRAPEALRTAGLRQKLENAGFTVEEEDDVGNVSWASSSRGPNGARNESKTVEACERVKGTMSSALQRGTLQLILSGECLYMPAILSAYWDRLEGTGKTVGVIYMDADSDLHTPGDPQGSGNIAGMTLTHLTLRDGCLESMKQFSRPDGTAVVHPDNIVLFGLNVGSEANKREHLGWLFDNSFNAVTATAVQAAPVECAERALKWMEQRVDYIVVHLDVDVIDPGEFPLCNVPNWTGLEFGQCMKALKVFLQSEKCVALSLAEVNPDHDPGLAMTGNLIDEVVDGLKSRAYVGPLNL